MDLSTAFPDASFDLVVSNPPYVSSTATLAREVADHEPSLALFAGPEGLDVYRRLIPEAARILRPGGWLVLELGDADGVPDRPADWREVEIRPALAAIPGVAIARR